MQPQRTASHIQSHHLISNPERNVGVLSSSVIFFLSNTIQSGLPESTDSRPIPHPLYLRSLPRSQYASYISTAFRPSHTSATSLIPLTHQHLQIDPSTRPPYSTWHPVAVLHEFNLVHCIPAMPSSHSMVIDLHQSPLPPQLSLENDLRIAALNSWWEAEAQKAQEQMGNGRLDHMGAAVGGRPVNVGEHGPELTMNEHPNTASFTFSNPCSTPGIQHTALPPHTPTKQQQQHHPRTPCAGQNGAFSNGGASPGMNGQMITSGRNTSPHHNSMGNTHQSSHSPLPTAVQQQYPNSPFQGQDGQPFPIPGPGTWLDPSTGGIIIACGRLGRRDQAMNERANAVGEENLGAESDGLESPWEEIRWEWVKGKG